MEKLEELHLTENTIFIFTSDNGGLHVPELCHEKVTHNTPYRAGKGYVYEGGQRVPLIVRWPGGVPAGLVINEPVNNIDWIPTLLELAGAPVPSGLDGISFAKGLLGGVIPERKMFWHFPHYTNQGSRPSGAMRDGNWLLVQLYDEEKDELYDLSADIGQAQDVAAQHPERVTAMRAALDVWRQENAVQYNKPNPHCAEEIYEDIYVNIDASRFDPVRASAEEWSRIREWRKKMDACRDRGLRPQAS
jgi:arylsulfatase A-like enzyme